ncbi:MAG TPA: retroviral-like aspartic protease family protein [Novosphingobium sp.]|nr:retroviral-like aspartic protease family protein [Novosphingobium sp.]
MTSPRAAFLLPLLAPLLAGASVPVSLGQDAAQKAGAIDLVEVRTDRQDRMTVSVRIGEAGPYRFLIDTGAERTVVSRSIAETLKLVPAGRATLVGVAGSLPVDMVEVDEIKLGRRSYYALLTPLLESHHMGADGIIGIDGLQGQRVLLDFARNTMAVSEANDLGGNRGFEIIVRAHRRSGQLIMTNAMIDGVKTDVVIDTGARTTIANRALQRALAKRGKLEQTSLMSVTGQSILADLAIVRRFKVGNLELNGVQIAFADAPPFARLDLADKPALLLGMNELRVFKRVAIDFESRKVLFDLPNGVASTRNSVTLR